MDRVIDAHIHHFGKGFLPNGWYEAVAAKWSASRFPNIERTAEQVEAGLLDGDEELLKKEMADAGVDAVVCLALDWGVHLGEAPVSIEAVHASYGDMQKKYQGWFYAVGGVDPRRPNATSIAADALEKHDLKGIKLYPPAGFLPSAPECDAIYDMCVQLNKPVVFHTAVIGYPHDLKYANPVEIVAVQRRFPKLRIVLAHSGYRAWVDEAIEIAASHEETYLEISNWNHELGTSASEERLTEHLKEMRSRVGAHRMLFASDHLGGKRFSNGRSKIKLWREFLETAPIGRDSKPLPQDEAALILGANAERVYDLT